MPLKASGRSSLTFAFVVTSAFTADNLPTRLTQQVPFLQEIFAFCRINPIIQYPPS
jgi:hypothetical protein